MPVHQSSHEYKYMINKRNLFRTIDMIADIYMFTD